MRRVRTGARYIYDPVMLDQLHEPYGVSTGDLSRGAIVRVVALPGCPKPNTMGHAHITVNGVFAGLVCTNSLVPLSEAKSRGFIL